MNTNTRLYKKEIEMAVKVCLAYYLKTMASEEIIAVYNYHDSDYSVHAMTEDELFEAVCINSNSKGELQIALRAVNSKRFDVYNSKNRHFCTAKEFENFRATNFPEYCTGYAMEFMYRVKQGEAIAEIKRANNSKAYYKASDTKDHKQIKCLGKNGASLAALSLILKACEEKAIDHEELVEAVKFLNKMYKED